MSLNEGLSCVLKCDEGYSHLNVYMTFIQKPTVAGVTFNIEGKDLPPGKKGFHVHQKGNLCNGCISLGPHYNPTGEEHGGLNDPRAHHGDLGNILIKKDGSCSMSITSRYLSLSELLGRSLVLHSEKDDLGKGGDPESLKTGNSGARICCGIIGFA